MRLQHDTPVKGGPQTAATEVDLQPSSKAHSKNNHHLYIIECAHITSIVKCRRRYNASAQRVVLDWLGATGAKAVKQYPWALVTTREPIRHYLTDQSISWSRPGASWLWKWKGYCQFSHQVKKGNVGHDKRLWQMRQNQPYKCVSVEMLSRINSMHLSCILATASCRQKA